GRGQAAHHPGAPRAGRVAGSAVSRHGQGHSADRLAGNCLPGRGHQTDGCEMSLPNTIPLFAPDFGPEEDREVLEVLHAGWIAMGPKVEAFEKCFADFVGAPHAVAVNSATAALHLANVLLGLRPGDEVIVPS